MQSQGRKGVTQNSKDLFSHDVKGHDDISGHYGNGTMSICNISQYSIVYDEITWWTDDIRCHIVTNCFVIVSLAIARDLSFYQSSD